MKVCTKCLRKLPLSHYHQDLTCRFGLKTRCKECERERHRLWREANPEKKAAANRRYLDQLRSDPDRLAIRQAKRRAYDQMRLEFLRRRRS